MGPAPVNKPQPATHVPARRTPDAKSKNWAEMGRRVEAAEIVEGMYERKEEAAAVDETPALRLASFILLRIFEDVGVGNLLTGNPSTSHQPRRPAVQSFRFNFFPFFSSLFLLRVFFFFNWEGFSFCLRQRQID